jgi:hypothetical protein
VSFEKPYTRHREALVAARKAAREYDATIVVVWYPDDGVYLLHRESAHDYSHRNVVARVE